jgi:hypothetical protein
MTYLQSSFGQYKLDLAKGNRNDVVDYVGIMDATATFANNFVTGIVCSVQNSTHTVVPGQVAVTDMPFWLWAGLDPSSAPDVTRTRGMPYSGAARCTLWGYKTAGEFSTTAFIAGSYPIGTPLAAIKNGATTPAKQGLMQPAASTDTVVGYVSPRGVATSADGWSTLWFYPAFIIGSTLPNA